MIDVGFFFNRQNHRGFVVQAHPLPEHFLFLVGSHTKSLPS